jgi:LPPG:FO 2-phospho-L-lactate transferase
MCAQDADVIVICPSNPYLSVDPILAVPGVREWLRASSTPVVAVSPIVAGEALKGPAARLLRDLAGESSVVQVARHYRDIADVLVLDERDSARRSEVEDLGLDVLVADTVMRSREDRDRLAGTIRSAVEARRGRR